MLLLLKWIIIITYININLFVYSVNININLFVYSVNILKFEDNKFYGILFFVLNTEENVYYFFWIIHYLKF